MAETKSVTAVLSAVDKNFVSTFNNASRATDSLASKIKGGIGFGALMSVGTKAMDAISGSIDGAVSRVDTLNNFPKVMKSMNFSAKETQKALDTMGDGIDKLPTTMDGIVQSTQMLTATLGDLNKGSKSAVALNDMFLSGGQGAEAAGRALTQYNQILAKGKVDQQSWNTMVEVAPAQMDQLAKATLGAKANQRDLYAALQEGKMSVTDLNDAIIKLDKEGGKGFDSFANQARAATGGIKTQMTNVRTAIVKGMANSIQAVDKALETNNLPKIGDMFGIMQKGVNSAFGKIQSYIPGVVAKVASSIKTFKAALQSTGALGNIKKALANVGAAFKNVFAAISSGGNIKSFANAIGMIASALAKAAGAAAKFIAGLPPNVINGIVKAFIGMKLGLAGLKTGMSIFGSGEGPLSGLVKGASQSKSKLSQIIKSMGPMFKGLGQGLGQTFKGVGDMLKSAFQGIGTIVKSLGPAFTGFAKVVQALGPAFKGLATVVKAMGPMFKGMGQGVAAALKGLKVVPPVTILAIGAALLMVCAGLALLATQAPAVSSVLTALGTAISTVIASIGEAIGTIVSAIIDGIAKAIVTISGVVPVICEGLAKLSPLVVAVGEAFAAAAPGIEALGNAISQIITAIGNAIATVMPTITQAVTAIVPVISSAISQIIAALGPFMPHIQAMVEAVAPVLQQIVQAFQQLVSQISPILESLANLVDTCLTGISDTVTSIGDSISKVVTSIGDSIANVLDSVAGIFDSIGNAALNAGKGFDLMAHGIKTLVDLKLGDLVATLKKTADGITDIASHSEGLPELGKGFSQLGTGIQKAAIFGGMASVAFVSVANALITMQAYIEGIPEAMTTAAAALQSFANEMKTTAEALRGSVTAFTVIDAATSQVKASLAVMAVAAASGAAMASMLASANRVAAAALNAVAAGARLAAGAIRTIPAGVVSTASAFNSMGQIGANAMRQLAASVKSGGTQAKAAITATISQMKQATTSGMSQIVTAGRTGMTQFASGIRAGGVQAVAAAKTTATSVQTTLKSASSGSYQTGLYIGQGLARGMSAALGQVRTAAEALAKEADKAARAKAKVASPSKVTAKTGRWIGLGLATGMLSSMKNVKNASKSLANAALKSLNKASAGKYQKTAEDLAKNYKTNLTKNLDSALNSVKSVINKKTKKLSGKAKKWGKNLTKSVLKGYSTKIKDAANKAIEATQNRLKAIGETYQKQYDEIISKRDSFYSKLTDYGQLYSADSYGFISLKNFEEATEQIKKYRSNLEKLKTNGLSNALFDEISQLSTAEGLELTNKMLKMSSQELKKYSASYQTYLNTAKSASNALYQSRLNEIQKNFTNAVNNEYKNLSKTLEKIGQQAMTGFVNGMNSKAKSTNKATKALAQSIIKTFKKYLKIHSPSKVTQSLGAYVGEGFAKGLAETKKMVEAVTQDIFTLPEVEAQAASMNIPDLYNNGEIDIDKEMTIEVPLTIDGREFAKATATFSREEINKLNKRDSRRYGLA